MKSKQDRGRGRIGANSDDARPFEILEQLCFRDGEWAKLVALYERRLGEPSLQDDVELRARLLLRLGQISEERCLDREKAIECYWKVVDLDGQHCIALRQLRQIHARREQWDVADRIAEMEAEAPMRPYERIAFQIDLGEMWLGERNDPERAREHFEKALEVDPKHPAALSGIACILEETGRHREAAKVWKRLIGALRAPERSWPQLALARLLAGPLEQEERAAELYRRALTDDPRNEEAVEALIASATKREQWDLLPELMERRFELAAGAKRRVEIAIDAGRLLLERVNDLHGARLWLARALKLESSDARVHAALADVERQAGDTDALLRVLDRALDVAADALPLEQLVEAAGIHAERGNDAHGLRYLRAAAERAPDDRAVLEALGDTLMRMGRYDELVDALERRAGLVADDAEPLADVLSELGALHEEQLEDADAAIDAFERAFRANPNAPLVAEALERLYRKTEAWEPLRRHLLKALDASRDRDRLGPLCSLARFLAERFDDPEGARRLVEEALTIDPNSPVALQGQRDVATATGDEDGVLSAYEREAENVTDPARLETLVSELVPMLEARQRSEDALRWVTRLLESTPEDRSALETKARLAEALGRDGERMDALERLDALLRGDEQLENRRRLAALHAESGRAQRAIGAYQRALELASDDVESLEALLPLLEGTNRVEELAATLRRLADLIAAPQRGEVLDRLATVLSEQLGDLDGAIVVLWRLASESECPPDAEQRLESHLERAGRLEELVQLLRERRDGLADDTPEAIALDLRCARLLLEPLGRFDEAVALLRSVRARGTESDEVERDLERALRAANDAAGLADYLADAAGRARDPRERARRELERAELLEESLQDVEGARTALERIAVGDADPQLAIDAEKRLERLLERSGDFAALRARLEAAVGRRGAESDRELHRRLAGLCRDRLGDSEGAIAHLEACARLDSEPAEVQRALALLYEEADRPADLLRVLEAELATGIDREREIAVRARAAQLCTGPLRDAEQAGKHYRRILELDPGDAAASEFLIERCGRQGRHEEAARLLQARLATLESARGKAEPGDSQAELRTSLRLRIAEVLDGRLQDAAGAIEILQQEAREPASRAGIHERLAELYQRTRRVEELAALCRRAADGCDDAQERSRWHLRLADALCQAGDPTGAADAYRRALAERPDDRDAAAALGDLYRSLGDPGALARLLESEAARLSGVEELRTRVELAALYRGPLEQPDQALLHLRRVLELEPGHRAALDGALEITERLGRVDELPELLDGALALARSPGERAELLVRRARLFAGPLNRADHAVAAYWEALSIDPGQAEPRRELRRVLESLGRWSAVLDALHLEAQVAESSELARIYAEAVEIAWARISPDAALPWLERLRAERPDDAAVVARVADVHRRAGRADALLRAIEDELALVASDERRRDLEVERARILEHELQSPGRAIAALKAARVVAPHDCDVLRELDRLYQSAGRPRERAEVLEALVAVVDAEEAVERRRELAALYAGPLAEWDRAAAHLLTAVAAAPATPGARVDGAARRELLRELARALRAGGRLEAWARAAEAELASLPPSAPDSQKRRRELQCELAKVYEHQLANPEAALRHLRAVVDSAAGGGDRSPGEEFERAETSLLQLLRAARRDVELERRLADRLARHPEDADRWVELARVRDERMHAPEAAAVAYREALKQRPDCRAALQGLRGVAERLGEWREVAHCLELEHRLGSALSTRERTTLLRHLGALWWDRFRDGARARRAYADAIKEDPRDLAALRSLQQLLETIGDWREAIDLYEREIEVLAGSEPGRRQQVWLRVGELARDRTTELGRAIRAYEKAAEIDRLVLERRAELAELHRRAGNVERFAEVFRSWCDDPESRAGCEDHVLLAATLEQLGRTDEALARVEGALELNRDHPPAWEVAARLRETGGDPIGAAEALEVVAEHRGDTEAAETLLRAAELVESEHPERSAQMLRRAVMRNRASAHAHAALARLAWRLGRAGEAERAAGTALDLGAAPHRMAVERHVKTALIGARAAREAGRLEGAARFYESVLGQEPSHPEALAELGEVLFELGEVSRAGQRLAARLALPDEGTDRARHLVIVANALEHDGQPDQALAKLHEALGLDPQLDDAHRGVTRLLEGEGRRDEAVTAHATWAQAAHTPEDQAAHWLRAAELLLEAGERPDEASGQLQRAVEADPRCERAWVLLAELHWATGCPDEALAVAGRALESVRDGISRARLCLVRGRAFEASGERRSAADAFGEAASVDARCTEAALSQARLLRDLGEWRAADRALARFVADHPTDESSGVIQVLLELGRMRSGPLEDMDGAIEAYERASKLDPQRTVARHALADLLVHRRDRWDEAIALHCEVLSEDPARVESLRALLQIARGRGSEPTVSDGLAILRALGVASPAERPEAPPTVSIRVARDLELSDPLWEKARLIAREAASEIAAALPPPPPSEASPSDGPLARFREALRAAEGTLTAAPLVSLSNDELRETLQLVATLALDRTAAQAASERARALASSLGPWKRLRLRRILGATTPEQIDAIDFGRWRTERRALAAAVALDEVGGDLRTTLVALTSDAVDGAAEELPESADLTPRIAACPEARLLLARVELAWAKTLGRTGGSS